LPDSEETDLTDPAPDFAGLAQAYARAAALPAARQRQLAAHLRQQARAHTVDDFYSRLATLFSGLTRQAETRPDDDIFLTYAPFPAVVPDFSWIMTMRFPEERREHFELCLRAQRDMRALLFRHVDFMTARRALDLGCGYGSDLIALARRHPGMELVGQTISSAQAAIGQARIRSGALSERIDIRCCDSATTRSGKPFDLVFGFEVIHHIADKASLFATIGSQLAPGGHLVAADFIAGDDLPIDDDKTRSGFLGRSAWAEHLARNGIEVVDAIDVSEPVANFLEDPNLDAHLDALGAAGEKVDEDIRAAFRGFVRLGELLRRGLATYMLLSARKVDTADVGALRARNEARLSTLISYDEMTPARWLYERQWIADRTPGSAAFDIGSVVEGLQESLETALAAPAIVKGRQVLPRAEALASAYAARALAD
jgi:myxalamid-type polyketide synthase MxaE and MxaD